LQRQYIGRDGKIAIALTVVLEPTGILLPDVLYFRPVVRLGERNLDLSCKATLEGLPFGSFLWKDGRTKGTFGAGRVLPKTGSYPVKINHPENTDAICTTLKVEPVVADKTLRGLSSGAEVSLVAKHRTGRAFVAVVYVVGTPAEHEPSWRATLQALKDEFEAGADRTKLRYLWGAIYIPDGTAVAATETAAETSLDLNVDDPHLMERLVAGTRAKALEAVLDEAKKEVADFQGNVDLLVVASTTFKDKCGVWASPLKDVAGSRTALVRIVGNSAQTKEGKGDVADGVRFCDKRTAGVTAEVEVAYEEYTVNTSRAEQLKLAIRKAAEGFK
jgi:hypothetical protein